MANRGKIYCEILKVPDNLSEVEINQYSMVLLIESRRMTQKRSLLPFFKESLQPHIDAIKPAFFDFFYENSKKTRNLFFSNKLIQCLWEHYLTESMSTFRNYFKMIRESERGPLKMQRFMEDVFYITRSTGFEVLPQGEFLICANSKRDACTLDEHDASI